MSKIGGVCTGFMLGLVVGCMIMYMVDVTINGYDISGNGLEGLAWFGARAIGLGLIFSIFGAVIGYFLGGISWE